MKAVQNQEENKLSGGAPPSWQNFSFWPSLLYSQRKILLRCARCFHTKARCRNHKAMWASSECTGRTSHYGLGCIGVLKHEVPPPRRQGSFVDPAEERIGENQPC